MMVQRTTCTCTPEGSTFAKFQFKTNSHVRCPPFINLTLIFVLLFVFTGMRQGEYGFSSISIRSC